MEKREPMFYSHFQTMINPNTNYEVDKVHDYISVKLVQGDQTLFFNVHKDAVLQFAADLCKPIMDEARESLEGPVVFKTTFRPRSKVGEVLQHAAGGIR